ncbi:outer membrane protein assembly factor BamE [Campylobacter geochelonis]|uniref:Plp4 n=1 Tax=Campylobacter geochelonis TaxID=1780362 RepID=A0A128EME2_9BACT|nr:outer membrane protein assembly factor BamE [Campylobacter geochelonis]CZE47144.1 Plp4 [Campylobacter geochelonis]CZE47879.1 Plp4 [Campylobacter geochelonis]CZE49989.1 Plp4 [Campylobacter geochelonis]
MKKRLIIISAVILMFALQGCVTKTSDNVPDNGILSADEVKFPEFDDAWIERGAFPRINDLKKIKAGMDKDNIRLLIGHPHYPAGLLGVREWDYLFNFRTKDGVKQCQYKVVFDKDYIAQSFFWKSVECEKLANAQAL